MADEFGPVEPVEKFGDVEPVAQRTKEDPLAQYPGTAFGLGSLNKLAMGGGSAALALKDMLSMRDSTTGENDRSGRSAKDLYLANKAFYDQGFERLGKANPKAELASNAALLVGPGMGAKIGTQVGRGVLRGVGQGLVGGEHSIAEDPKGVAIDAASGAALGGAGTLLGSLPGKVLEKVARGAGGRLFNMKREALRSAGGVAGKQGQEAAGGVENKFIAESMQNALASGNKNWIGMIPEPWIQKGIGARIANADQKIIDRNLHPIDVRALAEKILAGKGKAALTAAERRAMEGFIGGALGEGALRLGLDKRIGWAVGTSAPLYALRTAWQKVLGHPGALKAVSSLKPVGAAMSRAGARGGDASAMAIHLAVQTKKDPELAQALLDAQAEFGGYEPAQDEPDGLTYRKRSADGSGQVEK